MTVADQPKPPLSARGQSRLDRQARVGILRNLNEPPRPPARKPPLMGRWLSLRSGRRPQASQIEGAARAVVAQAANEAGRPSPELALRRDAEGRVSGIDVATLMASVHGLGVQQPIRAPYGAQLRTDIAPASDLAPPADAALRDAIAPRPAPPPAPRPVEAPRDVDRALAATLRTGAATPPPRRRSTARLVAAGLVIAMLVLVILPAVLSVSMP